MLNAIFFDMFGENALRLTGSDQSKVRGSIGLMFVEIGLTSLG